MGWQNFKVRVRGTAIAEVNVRVYSWSTEDAIKAAVKEAESKSRRVILQRARRPVTGGEFEVLTIEPTQDTS